MELDARKDIQAMVERVIPGLQLGDIVVERKIALSYVTSSTEDNMEYYIKLLCFEDKHKNCIHVRIQTDREDVPKYLTKTEPMMVRDEVTPFV